MLDHISFVHGGIFTSDEPWIHPKISVQTTEIIIMLKGEAHLFEDGDSYDLRENNYLIFEPEKMHGGSAYSYETVSFYWFHFDGSLPQNMIQKTGSLVERDRIDLLCRQLLHYANTPTISKCASDYSLRLLLLEMEQQCHDQKSGSIKFSEICEWIRINGDRPLTSEIVAQQFGYHEDYLARLFRKNLDISMKQYIIRSRMSYLKTQLLSTNLTLKEIAFNAGFQDYKYFLKYFTSYAGITPTAFRNSYSNTHRNKH